MPLAAAVAMGTWVHWWEFSGVYNNAGWPVRKRIRIAWCDNPRILLPLLPYLPTPHVQLLICNLTQISGECWLRRTDLDIERKDQCLAILPSVTLKPLYNPGQPETQNNLPASAPSMLESQVCSTIPSRRNVWLSQVQHWLTTDGSCCSAVSKRYAYWFPWQKTQSK